VHGSRPYESAAILDAARHARRLPTEPRGKFEMMARKQES
jgi:hypothetical protein